MIRMQDTITAVGVGAADGLLTDMDRKATPTARTAVLSQWSTWAELLAVLGGWWMSNQPGGAMGQMIDPVTLAVAGGALFTKKAVETAMAQGAWMPESSFAVAPASMVASPSFPAVHKQPTLKIY